MAGHGGARPGAGRKSRAFKRVIHATPIQEAEGKIRDRLPWLVDQMMILAEGVEVQRTDRQGKTRIYYEPPDRGAIEYLIDRILGKPTQPVDMRLRQEAEALARAYNLDPDRIIDLAQKRKARAS